MVNLFFAEALWRKFLLMRYPRIGLRPLGANAPSALGGGEGA